LSHAAIQAREYGLICVVGVADAVRTLETGTLVRIDLDGQIEVLETGAAQQVAGRILDFQVTGDHAHELLQAVAGEHHGSRR
jgi:phosphoenolpyruvate synthase/pyruvate phosphate dikinase